jgi:hypothetical protein
MNTLPTGTGQSHDTLLDLVDFKWLMAGHGWRVDLTRLQRDEAYMRECLARALQTRCALLQARGAMLLGLR